MTAEKKVECFGISHMTDLLKSSCMVRTVGGHVEGGGQGG